MCFLCKFMVSEEKMVCAYDDPGEELENEQLKTFFTTFFKYSFHVHVRHVFNIYSLSDTFDLTGAHFFRIIRSASTGK